MLKQARLSSCQNLFGSISGLDATDLISLEVHQLGIVACDCRSGVGRCGGRQNATLLSVWELRPHHQRHFQRRTSYVVHCQRRQQLVADLFTARRYTGVVLAVVMCLSVRLSVTCRYCTETNG